MLKVRMRGGFSDRNQIKPENTEMQVNGFDSRTRVQLLNMIKEMHYNIYGRDTSTRNSFYKKFVGFLIGTVYAEPFNPSEYYDEVFVYNYFDKTINEGTFDDILTLLEAIINFWDLHLKENFPHLYYNALKKTYIRVPLFQIANQCFEQEYVGYRFVDGIITPITDSGEIATINETLNCLYKPIRDHVQKATALLSDRVNPDYENSIKESISAVEAICKIVVGADGGEATLGNMLKRLEESGVRIHGSMKEAFQKLYGYTSDANGIRHAGDIGGPSSTFEEAKFMLVACSAFINYLIALNAD